MAWPMKALQSMFWKGWNSACVPVVFFETTYIADEAGLDEAEVATVREYHSLMDELLECLTSLQQKWVEYEGIIEASNLVPYRPRRQSQG